MRRLQKDRAGWLERTGGEYPQQPILKPGETISEMGVRLYSEKAEQKPDFIHDSIPTAFKASSQQGEWRTQGVATKDWPSDETFYIWIETGDADEKKDASIRVSAPTKELAEATAKRICDAVNQYQRK